MQINTMMKPDKRLADTKVYVAGKSKEIQEKAFRLGYKWYCSNGDIPQNFDCSFLYFYKNGDIAYSRDMNYFMKHTNREVIADYILSLEPEPECPFKPFDKVLMREDNEFEWRPKLFSRVIMDEEYSYCSIDCFRFKYCIPYEGNEHLAFTTDSPKQ